MLRNDGIAPSLVREITQRAAETLVSKFYDGQTKVSETWECSI